MRIAPVLAGLAVLLALGALGLGASVRSSIEAVSIVSAQGRSSDGHQQFGGGAALENARSAPAASSPASTPGGTAVDPAIAAPRAPRLDPAPWAPPPQLKASAASPPAVASLSALVLDEGSGQVLFEQDGHHRLPIASLTKIAAAIVVLREGDLDTEVLSDVDGFAMRGSSIMGLNVGDRLSRNDLLYGLMLPSGNDAALALGRSVAGSDEAFVARMNTLAVELGLRDTYLTTPHGLGRTGYSTAYDLALLSRYAMQLPKFAGVVGTTSWETSGSRRIPLYNVNSFLFSYAGADGVKTGYTNSAGKTLVASATRGGHRLYAVLLNDAQVTTDAMQVLDWAFANHRWDAHTAGPTAPPLDSASAASANETRP